VGLFDIFKRSDKPEKQKPEQGSTPDFKILLDEVEKKVFATLKPIGFKKKGRTFNRETEKGIFQVINFQSGQYPIGKNYEVPGLRENLYGRFAVNLGVCVGSLYKFQYPNENKYFYKEYECHIRTRLCNLTKGHDYWWKINNNADDVANEINEGLATAGLDWLAGVDTKDKIIKNLGNAPYTSTPRAKLDVALLVWFDDKEKATDLFNEYLHSIPKSKNGHKEYVEELAKEMGIKVT
jgi:hypothetical protein